MKYTTTITAVSVHPIGENPIFGETTTTVRLDDEAAGAYIVLSQEGGNTNIPPRSVLIEPDELDLIFETAKMLLSQGGVNEGGKG